jgi:hypothetical protein
VNPRKVTAADVAAIVTFLDKARITPAHIHYQPYAPNVLGIWLSGRADFMTLVTHLRLTWRVRENNTQDPVTGERHYLTHTLEGGSGRQLEVQVQALSKATDPDWDAPTVEPEPDLFADAGGAL